jgi:mono/diheme cytochrome c family protein
MGKLRVAMMAGILTVALAGCSPEREEPVVEAETTFAEGGTGFAFDDGEDGLPEAPVEGDPAAPAAAETAPGTAPPQEPTPAGPVEEAAPSRSEPAPREEPATPSPSRTPAAPASAAPAPAAAPSPAPAAASASGRDVFLEQNCQRCHAVSAAGIEAKVTTGRTAGGDLSASTLDRAALRAVAQREREVDDRRHPGQFKGTPDELETLVDWLITQRR